MAEKEQSDTGLTVTGTRFGPTREELAAIGDRAMTLERVRKVHWLWQCAAAVCRGAR